MMRCEFWSQVLRALSASFLTALDWNHMKEVSILMNDKRQPASHPTQRPADWQTLWMKPRRWLPAAWRGKNEASADQREFSSWSQTNCQLNTSCYLKLPDFRVFVIVQKETGRKVVGQISIKKKLESIKDKKYLFNFQKNINFPAIVSSYRNISKWYCAFFYLLNKVKKKSPT